MSVRGSIVSGPETFALVSDACQTDNRAAAMIWLDTPPVDDQPYARSVSSSEFLKAQMEGGAEAFVSSLEWIRPAPVSFQRDANFYRLQQLLRQYGLAIATISGRLDHEEAGRITRNPEGKLRGTWWYGHLNGFSRRIVVERVKDVERDRR